MKYKTTFKNGIYTFTQIKRHGNIVLFEEITALGSKQYELHILRYRMAHPKSAEAGTKILSSPSTSEWGKYGWTYQTRERADEKFQLLVARDDQNADSSDSVAA